MDSRFRRNDNRIKSFAWWLRMTIAKFMKIKELRQKTAKELKDLLTEICQKLGRLKFDLASKKLKNVRELKELRKDIARILTILNKKNEIKNQEK